MFHMWSSPNVCVAWELTFTGSRHKWHSTIVQLKGLATHFHQGFTEVQICRANCQTKFHIPHPMGDKTHSFHFVNLNHYYYEISEVWVIQIKWTSSKVIVSLVFTVSVPSCSGGWVTQRENVLECIGIRMYFCTVDFVPHHFHWKHVRRGSLNGKYSTNRRNN